MKQYLITEEELSIYLRLLAVKKHETDLTFKEIADDFLKDKQPVELLAEDYKLQQKAINTLNESGLKLMEENKKLQQQLSEVKTLNRQEMAEFIKKHQNLRIKLNDYVKKIIELEDKIKLLEGVNNV